MINFAETSGQPNRRRAIVSQQPVLRGKPSEQRFVRRIFLPGLIAQSRFHSHAKSLATGRARGFQCRVAPTVRPTCSTQESFDRLIAHQCQKRPGTSDATGGKMDDRSNAECRRECGCPRSSRFRPFLPTTASTNRGDYCISKAALSRCSRRYFASRLAGYGINSLRDGI